MGWIERYVEFGRSRSPAAPVQYHEVVALFVLGTVVGPKVYMHLASGKLYTHLWPMLLGNSGTTKKSTCMDFAVDMLQEIMPDAQIVESFNVEGLVDELNEHTEAGVAHIYTVQDEFGRLLGDLKFKDYMKGLKDVMMKLYDGKPPGRRTRKVQARFKQVYMTMLAGTTEQRLFDLLTRSDIEDGFWPRLFPVQGVGDGYAPQPEMTPEMFATRQSLVSDLRTLKTFLGNNPPVRMTFDAGAKEFWDDWCYQLDVKVHRGEFAGSIASRMSQNLVKLCMLWEVSKSISMPGLMVSPHRIGLARAVAAAEKVEVIGRYSNDLYAKLGRHRRLDAVRSAIKEAGPEGIVHGRLLRRLGMTLREFSQYIKTLLETEEISAEEMTGRGGTRTVYRFREV